MSTVGDARRAVPPAISLVLVLSSVAPAGAQPSSAVTFDAWVGLARVGRDSGDPGGAVNAWREAARLRPLAPELQQEFFWPLSVVEPHQARVLARALLAARPTLDDVRERAIGLATDAGDDREVSRLARDGLAIALSSRWTRALGTSALARGDHQAAVQWLRDTVNAPDHQPADEALLAVALSAAGDDKTASAIWASLPMEVWEGNDQWVRSRLKARIRAAWAVDVKTEAEAWMRDHPDDHGMRGVLIGALQRAGDHASAMSLALESPDDTEWLRLRARIADQARRPDVARAARRELARRTDATIDDRLSSAEWFRKSGNEAEALRIASRLVPRSPRCADEVVSLLFRLESDRALNELASALRGYPQKCPAYQTWTRGLVGKLMAVHRFAEASEFAEPLSEVSAAPRDREIVGQLRLWTGDPAGARWVLLPLVDAGLATTSGLDAVIDALRAEHRTREAWRLARGRLEQGGLNHQRALSFAELAIDSGEVSIAAETAGRVATESSASQAAAFSVLGQARLAGGHAAAALEALERIPADVLDVRGRAALVAAQATVAEAYLSKQSPLDAIDVLTRSRWGTFPPSHRRLLARAYGDAGRVSDALDTLSTGGPLSIDDGLYRVALMQRVARAEDVDREYARLADRADATADVYVLWARVRPEGPQRMAVLSRGHERFADHSVLALELASAHHLAGNAAPAAALARQVIADDERESRAWAILVDQARTRSASDLGALGRIPVVFADDAPVLIWLAERLGAVGGSTAASEVALGWLRDARVWSPEWHVARELARARVLNSHGQLPAALTIVAPLAAEPTAAPDVLRLHAQLLGWNGYHNASLKAYDRYLSLVPDDREARREQARVAGWAQQFERADRLYLEIFTRFPGDQAARAEAEAKRLFFASRWREAEHAYQKWLDVEPLNEEAAFEYAETLVAQGRLSEAREAYNTLAGRPRPHQVASLARRTLDERADPSVSVMGLVTSSRGYGGSRMLDTSEIVGRVAMPVLDDSRQVIDVSASSLQFADPMVHVSAYRMGASALTTKRWGSVAGSASLVRGEQDVSYWEGRAQAAVKVKHDLDVHLSLARAPLLENMTTVRANLTVWGPSVTVLFASPDTELAGSAGVVWAPDNAQRTAGVSLRQRLHRGASDLRVVLGVNYSDWDRFDPRFFSPQQFVRADAGAEWTRWLRAPRFRLDRRSSMMLRYLIGTDSNGELYHQPAGRLSLEHRRMALDADAGWIVSPVYRSLSLRLGMRLGG
jgi:tetratricopeptide (TPR) repeat protein